MRALLTCGGGTLVFESREYAVSVEAIKEAEHHAPVSLLASLLKIDANTAKVLRNLKNRRMGDSSDSVIIETYPTAEACKTC